MVTLSTSLSPSLAGTSCAVKTFSDTIVVRDVPQVTLNTPDPICITSSYTPTYTVNSCYDQSGLTYNWNFGNTANPTTTNQQNPIVSFNQSGVKPYSITINNSCGGSTDNENITVNQNVVLDANAVSNSCEAGPINLSGTITGGATTGGAS